MDGVSKVVVLVGDKTGKQKPSAHCSLCCPTASTSSRAIEIIALRRSSLRGLSRQLQQSADGPYRGSASKDLELVEFADFQCPHCKEAQANMDKLAVDFPKARIVFQNYPLTQIHPAGRKGSRLRLVRDQDGRQRAFFQFAAAVFDGQDGLATPMAPR